MASPGNANQPGGGGPFDIPKFFNPSPSTSPNSNSHLIFPSPSASYPSSTTAPYNPQFPQYTNPPQHLHQQRSVSFPTPPLQPPAMLIAPQSAMLTAPQSTMSMPPIQPTNSGSELSDFSGSPYVGFAHSGSGPVWMLSSKLPTGRHLKGDEVVYDIDVRLPGEVQPQLEVTPITKYGSEPGLVLGRQIAVNRTYICYGLKLGAIRVLNMNTALRSLLKGLSQVCLPQSLYTPSIVLCLFH